MCRKHSALADKKNKNYLHSIGENVICGNLTGIGTQLYKKTTLMLTINKTKVLIWEKFFPVTALLRSPFVTGIINMDNFDASKCG